MTNDQTPKNDQNRMPKPMSRHSDTLGHWCLGFLWSFDIGLLSFAPSERLPHPDPGPVVQFAQAAGGDNLARFEPGEDLLATFLHTADLDLARASLVLLDDENPGQSRESAHGIERSE